ncbi:hypothetical protein [Serratia symbiotica]|uniref:Uncharacterized protein n=1 Tax=Serratia symbiotica TaxID=138074 RepID=A0A7D5SS29_9GAMM|nr:hypothetical protein [Serratia symbiotica]MBQ0956591.1 hypothetical protein [Serratia symbiotica]QLH62594.1 hypothetical protein SYMBAF_06110 [Serratia symbiotica]
MSELDLNTNHRILPAELCGPAPLADRYRQRGLSIIVMPLPPRISSAAVTGYG